jgi:hypothetical protein
MSHEVNLLWAAHVVHHQSEDYNLAVALRQSVLTDVTAWPFYLPLAFLGVPPLVFAVSHDLSTLYQFWIHTEQVGKLGSLEHVINTPSHHRVHHAINPRYLDKNYGATFMLWDQLFGTFTVEQEPCVYGTVAPLASFNPLWAQVAYLVEMGRAAWRTPRLIDKVQVWWRPPTWQTPGCEAHAPHEVSPATYRKYDPPSTPWVRRYVAAQLVAALVVTYATIYYAPRLGWPALAAAASLVALGTLVWGGLFEARRWARPLELGRLALVVAAVAAFWPAGRVMQGALVAVAAFAVGAAAWLALGRLGPAPAVEV